MSINCLTFTEPVPNPPTSILFWYVDTSLTSMLKGRGIRYDAEKMEETQAIQKASIPVEKAQSALKSILSSAQTKQNLFQEHIILPLTFLGSIAITASAIALTGFGAPLIAGYILISIGIMVLTISLIEALIGKYTDTTKAFQDIQSRARGLLQALKQRDPKEKILLCRQKDHTFAPQTPFEATTWETLPYSRA